jgi:Zn-dependent M28 family amino/carboxypeptidase
MREILSPFRDDGFVGAVPSRSRGLGGSDHTSFNNAGLPGIGMGQDPIEYGSHTWHTNLDTYERILEDDVKKAAIGVAWGVYNLAMRDDVLPRFAKGAMPTRPRPAATDISVPSPVPTKSKPVVSSKSKTKAKARDRQRRRRN